MFARAIGSHELSYDVPGGYLHHDELKMGREGTTGRRSLLALMRKMVMAKTATTPPAIPVLRCQLAGEFHQPPAGDQTCK